MVVKIMQWFMFIEKISNKISILILIFNFVMYSSQETLESNVCKSKRPEVTLETVQSMMGWTFTYDTPEHVKAQLDEAEAEYEQV